MKPNPWLALLAASVRASPIAAKAQPIGNGAGRNYRTSQDFTDFSQ